MGVRKTRRRTLRRSASSRCRAKAPSAWCAKAIQYAIDNNRPSGGPGAQGQHREVHRRAVSTAGVTNSRRREFGADLIDQGPVDASEASGRPAARSSLRDVIADAFLQQILLRPRNTALSPRSISTAITSPTRWRRRSAASASRRARIFPTPWRCSRPRTAPPQVCRQGPGESGLDYSFG